METRLLDSSSSVTFQFMMGNNMSSDIRGAGPPASHTSNLGWAGRCRHFTSE